ncbi:hypothetical protein U9M48_005177 [Paspalum notatum var. saurae]|uniref:Uncharacterized protein n=1 Tax=Paspalum notatum var. saurae TaxID=547442 RepID=A0AAQ3PRM3_PASNO
MEGQARKLEKIEELWSKIDLQNKNEKIIDKGKVQKTRKLINEAKEKKERLSQEELNSLLNVDKELAKLEKVLNRDANPNKIPGAVIGKITGIGSY